MQNYYLKILHLYPQFFFINTIPKYLLISGRRETKIAIKTQLTPVVLYLIIKCFQEGNHPVDTFGIQNLKPI